MKEIRFNFGDNWSNYIDKHFSQAALQHSVNSLKDFLPIDLKDKSFIDVGCGSGIHSLAAVQLGATNIVSIDYDVQSVETTRRLKHDLALLAKWEIMRGSILDKEFINALGKFDIVYCWGVAHHTGDMYEAMDRLYNLVAPGGYLFIAIYNEVDGRFGSVWWKKVKKFYNESSHFVRKTMEYLYILYKFFRPIIGLNNPFTVAKEYKWKRGMSLTTDLIDWLGGYPYEYAKPEVIFDFYKKKNMELVKLKTTRHIGCNQFVFLRK